MSTLVRAGCGMEVWRGNAILMASMPGQFELYLPMNLIYSFPWTGWEGKGENFT